MLGRSLLLAAVWVITLPCYGAQESGSGAAATGDNLVLDGTGYFTQYTEFGLMRLNSEVLKNEGEKLFGPRLKDIERNVKRLLKPKNCDWTKTDWRDVACYHFPSIQTGDDSLAVSLLPTVPLPADWAKPDFDDSSFLHQRIGILSPIAPQNGSARAKLSVHRRALYARTYLEIAEPDKVAGLTLRVVYRGGVRVLLNGEEIVRKDLPAGPLGPESLGTDYPREAYMAHEDEVPAGKGPAWVGDLRCPFDMAPKSDKAKDMECHVVYGGSYVNRAGWERLMKLRDRELGPVPVPARLLRKGINVLAFEVHTSSYDPFIIPGAGDAKATGWLSIDGANGLLFWDHLRLVNVELRGKSQGISPCRQRPAGVQAWVDDIHTRLFDRDYNPAGWPVGKARFVAAQNGTFAAQLGVSTDRELAGLKATVSDLTGAGAAKLPASAIQVQYLVGHGLDELSQLGWFRSFDTRGRRPCIMSDMPLYRYADGVNVYGNLPKDRNAAQAARMKFLQDFKFFDHITATAPEKVPANSCQPIWLTLKVPAATPAGLYKGTVTIQAAGAAPLAIPVEAEVIGWRVPDPLDFQLNVESEQSPYGVAKVYKCDLWSDRHFELMETSFRQLARLGDDWIFVPVLLSSELGNRDDPGPIKWIRKKDGTLTFDYTLLDRYLALARKYMAQPKVICFLIMHGDQSPSNAVSIWDEASGKAEVVEVGPAQESTRGPLWKAFGTVLYAHMRTLGLHDSMFWGHAFDDTFDPGLIGLMAQVVPEVGWAAGGHTRRPDPVFRAVSAAMGPDLGPVSMQGWKNQFLHCLAPRLGGSVLCVEGISTPFTWRVWCDRTIYAGMNGLGRVGADYFDGTWSDGFRGTGWNQVGRPCVQTLWPGTSGVESGARNEVLIEGIQEAEARIFMEQALDRKLLPEELAAETQKVLDDHFRATLHIAAGGVDTLTMDIHGDWQARSRRLFQAAAKAAAATGLDVDRTAFGRMKVATFHGRSDVGARAERVGGDAVRVPALGRTRLALKLRNWSAAPRAFKAVSSESWIVPEKAEGTITGQQEFGIILDGKTLHSGTEVSGSVTILDTASGTSIPVSIDARVDKAIEYRTVQQVRYETGGGSGGSMPHLVTIEISPVFNVTAGGLESREYLLVNNTSSPLSWKMGSSHVWLAVSPSAGELAGHAVLPVKLVATPKDQSSAAYDVTLTLAAANDAVKEPYLIKVFVIPPYQAPAAPQGRAVFLNELDQKTFVKSHVEKGGVEKNTNVKPAPCYHRWHGEYGENLNQKFNQKGTLQDYENCPYTMQQKTYSHGFWVYPRHETAYAIAGAGFTSFAAEVGFFDGFAKARGANAGALVNFEIYVDGQLRAQSGLVGVKDAPRLLVVDNLENAKELKLVTRRNDLANDSACLATWGDPRFIKTK